MKQAQINILLKENYQHFIVLLKSFTEKELNFSLPGKWSAAQQAEHILKSVRPVTIAFTLPVFIPRLIFGKTNRPSRSFDTLKLRYDDKLTLGGRASSPFVPAANPVNLGKALSRIEKNIDKLTGSVERKSEEELDLLILPHPLLGKLTLREMLYFTIFHVVHHEETIKNQLTKMNYTDS